jgi:hypothetical protein
MKRYEVVEFHAGCEAFMRLPDKYDEYTTYAVSRNKRTLQPIVESIKDGQKPLLEEYNKKLRELGIKHAEKDDKGKPIVLQNGGVHLGNNAMEYTADKEALDKEYKEKLDSNDKFMEEEEKVEIYILKHKFPDMPSYIADALFTMRQEPKEPEPEKK